jgi:hypothetical protein
MEYGNFNLQFSRHSAYSLEKFTVYIYAKIEALFNICHRTLTDILPIDTMFWKFYANLFHKVIKILPFFPIFILQSTGRLLFQHIQSVRKRLYPFLFFLVAQCVESGVSCTDCY